MKKVKLLFRVAKKALGRILRGDFKYRGRSIFSYVAGGVKYFFKYGPKNFIRQSKQFLVSIDRRLGNNLAFPNGLVTGADKGAIKDWYERHAKKVTIVIPSYNDEEYLAPCIESLKQTTNPKYTKIIIVDDYCQPSSREFLKKTGR
jgi:cellulose synthase/poly-beta-1,6-N-acetylglucosamine synthase-like glycosyltransferase